ncbi:hypothetical protein GBA52_010744 [Prunus armeniaca]|nr:hypothetical protein GBA52_010744 [Prunus armeniaca]
MCAVYHTWIYHGEKFGLPKQDATHQNGVKALGPNDVTYDILNDAFPRYMNQDLHGECDTFGGTMKVRKDKRHDQCTFGYDKHDIRRALHLHRDETSLVKKYPTIYTLSPHQRQSFCEFLKSVKFPDWYAANISKNVKECRKISGLKSHDCHVLLQRLLPVGIRLYLPKEVLTTSMVAKLSITDMLLATNEFSIGNDGQWLEFIINDDLYFLVAKYGATHTMY